MDVLSTRIPKRAYCNRLSPQPDKAAENVVTKRSSVLTAVPIPVHYDGGSKRFTELASQAGRGEPEAVIRGDGAIWSSGERRKAGVRRG
jgi:hypothetical protein